MKVTSSGPGLPPEVGTAESGVGGPAGPSPAGFAEKIERARDTKGASALEGPSQATVAGADRPPHVQDIAAELRAGRIDGRTALDHVVTRIVDRQVGVNAPSQVREQVASALREALANDPMLVAKVRDLDP
jgi:hypothetical protein